MSRLGPMCGVCKHWPGLGERGGTCAAYPNRIPHEIIIRQVDHRQPYDGDRGIQFEPRTDLPAELVERQLATYDA